MRIFKAALSVAFLAGSALAQLTQIASPTPGSTLTAGSQITVQVDMEEFPENIDIVSIVIGLAPCDVDQCSPPSVTLGEVLYQGPYTPGPGYSYENYTVMIPESFPAGNASLNVVSFSLIGVAYIPTLSYLNETVTVVA